MLCNFSGTAIFIRKTNHIRLGISRRDHRNRPHMFCNHLFFNLIQLEILSGIFVSRNRMGDRMKPVPRLSPVLPPIIKKKIVKHPSPGSRTGIQPQMSADTKIIIRHIQAVIITVRITMLIKVLHLQDHRMRNNILDTLIKFLIFFLRLKSLFSDICR